MANVFPQQFGPYTLHQLVGRGGMAEIYRATMPGIGTFEKVLAIKKILPHLVENEEYITMLTDEARLVVGLNHANIAQVYDLGRIDESYYIAMEYIHGVDIALIIKDAQKKQRHVPYEHTAYMMSGLCMGLHVAHHATGRDDLPLNIIHRDISPHNVLISFAGDVKVIDFGVAKASSKEGQTQVGVIKGKLLYMAPEQAMAKDIDGRADLFAAGLVMYKLLTWQLPFQGENEFQIYNNILTKEIVPPKVLNPQIPEELNQICMTLLQRDVDRRYQDGYAVKRELERALHHIAPGYTPSRLSRFIEDNFLEQVQERLRKQNSTPAQRAAAASANARIKEPVRSGAQAQGAQAQGMQPQGMQAQQGMPHTPRQPQSGMNPSPAPMPAHSAPQRQSTVNPGFGPTPVPSDPSPMTPNGFQAPTHQTPAAGYNTAQSNAFMRTQNQGNLATGSFAPPGMTGALPAPNTKKKGVPAILIAVILLGVLFLGMGVYVFISSMGDGTVDPVEDPAIIAPPSVKVDPPVVDPPVIEDEDPVVEQDAPATFALTTEPTGALVLRNGMRQGVAPLNIELEELDYPTTLTISMEGYEEQEVALTRESERALRIILVKSEPIKDEPIKPNAPKNRDKPQDKPDVDKKDTGIKVKTIKDDDPDKGGFDIFTGKTKNKDKPKTKPKTHDKTPADTTDGEDKKLDNVLDGW